MTDIHHIFGGRFRQMSERMGLVIELCRECHSKAHNNREFGDALKHDAELDWLEQGRSLEEWMDVFHRTWVTEDELGVVREAPTDPFDDIEGTDRWITKFR